MFGSGATETIWQRFSGHPTIKFTSFLPVLLLCGKVSCPYHPFSSSWDPTPSHLPKAHALFSNIIIQSKCLLIFSILRTRQTCSRVHIPTTEPPSVSILHGNHPRMLFVYAAFTNSPIPSKGHIYQGTPTSTYMCLRIHAYDKL